MFYLPKDIKQALAENYGFIFDESSGMVQNFFDVVRPNTVVVVMEDGSKLELKYSDYFVVTCGSETFTVILTEHCGYYYYYSESIEDLYYYTASILLTSDVV